VCNGDVDTADLKTEKVVYSVVHGEVQSSSDNPIVRTVEIPAAAIDQTENSTGDFCFYYTVVFFQFIVAFLTVCTVFIQCS